MERGTGGAVGSRLDGGATGGPWATRSLRPHQRATVAVAPGDQFVRLAQPPRRLARISGDTI